MSAEFTKEDWGEVWKMLQPRAVATSWWEANKDTVVGLAREEAADIFDLISDGDTFDAKLAIASRMTRGEWVAYRARTTAQLHIVAQRRARLFDALEDLGKRAAQAVGTAALEHLRR